MDQTVGDIGVEGFPTERYTVRQLLEHRTGIPNYHDTTDYAADEADPVVRAIASAVRAPQQGFGQYYSSTNYLILGRHVEALTGQSLDTLITTRLLGPYGIDWRFTRAESIVEAPGGGGAGLMGNLHSLLAWGDVLLRRHVPLNDDAWSQMTTLDPATSLGAGAYGYCPCFWDDYGDPHWRRIGHSGGTTSLQYDASSNLLIALQLPTGVWGVNTQAVEVLVARLVAAGE